MCFFGSSRGGVERSSLRSSRKQSATWPARRFPIVSLPSICTVMLIVTRNFNLSVGSAVALVGVVLVLLTVRYDLDLALAVLAAVASGVLGAFVGTLLMGSLNNDISPMSVPTFYQETAREIVLLLAVTVDQLAGRRGDEHQQSHWPDP